MNKFLMRLAVGAAFVAAAVSAHAGETLDRVMSKKAMVVATNSGWPPQSYLDDNNEMVGFDIDVAREIGKRLQTTRGDAVLMITKLGTGSYAMPGGPMNDPKGDAAYFAALKAAIPATIEVVEGDLHAEDPAFVDECVDRLIGLIEARPAGPRKAPRRSRRRSGPAK